MSPQKRPLPMSTLQDITPGQPPPAKCQTVLSGGVNRSDLIVEQPRPPHGVVGLLLTAPSAAGLARSHASLLGDEKRADDGAIAAALPPRRM